MSASSTDGSHSKQYLTCFVRFYAVFTVEHQRKKDAAILQLYIFLKAGGLLPALGMDVS